MPDVNRIYRGQTTAPRLGVTQEQLNTCTYVGLAAENPKTSKFTTVNIPHPESRTVEFHQLPTPVEHPAQAIPTVELLTGGRVIAQDGPGLVVDLSQTPTYTAHTAA